MHTRGHILTSILPSRCRRYRRYYPCTIPILHATVVAVAAVATAGAVAPLPPRCCLPRHTRPLAASLTIHSKSIRSPPPSPLSPPLTPPRFAQVAVASAFGAVLPPCTIAARPSRIPAQSLSPTLATRSAAEYFKLS